MKREFVRTENAKRFRAAIAMLEARGAQEAGWLLVTGRPGERRRPPGEQLQRLARLQRPDHADQRRDDAARQARAPDRARGTG